MKTLSLEARIAHSKKVMSMYPDWVKNSSRFQGGGVVRDQSGVASDTGNGKKIRRLEKEAG